MQAKQASMRERMGDMKMRQGVFGGGQQPPVLGQPQGMPPGTPKGGSAMPPGATVADGAGQNNFGPGVDNYAPPPGGAPPANGGKMGGSSVAGGASDPNMPPPSPGGGGYAPKGAQSSFAGGLA
jgi:hypothetical protein